MKTYPYNRTSVEGRRLFKLLDFQFNKGSLTNNSSDKTFETNDIPAVMQCRANKVGFIFPSNLSGLKRPQIRLESDVELAWGDFGNGITTLDFTHDNQELPLTYVQPLEDDTIKMLIDAGLYRDDRFEELMSKLMTDEVFDAEADMKITHLDVGNNPEQGESLPVILVDPVDVVHDDHDPSEHTTIANLVKRSARLAIELRNEGVKTEDLVRGPELEQDQEIFILDEFRDIVAQKDEEQIEREVDESFSVPSELLDREIDVTEKLKGGFGFDRTSEDDRIRDLKDKERYVESETVVTPKPKSEPVKQSESRTTEADVLLDPDTFGRGLDDYKFEDDGPEL